ncbi:MAG: hypothetical protein DSY81_07100 [Bacillota bacterium]|nr:MAG: hypothetical protein DSY81_07100 [Bacillota bacterium]
MIEKFIHRCGAEALGVQQLLTLLHQGIDASESGFVAGSGSLFVLLPHFFHRLLEDLSAGKCDGDGA